MSISTLPRHRATLVLTNTDGAHEMSMAIDMAQIPIPQAATAAGIPEAILRHLIAAGVIASDEGLCDLDQVSDLAAELAAARNQVDGQPILATEAAERYGFDVNSIYKWHRDGWVSMLEYKVRGKLFNEGDIAVARLMADKIGHVPGRAVFPAKPRSGRPRKSND